MKKDNFSWGKFNAVPIVGIIRGMSVENFYSVLPVYINSGLSTLEITMNTPNVEDMISYAAKYHSSDLNIGAGTVCNTRDLDKALSFGAQFIVTPVVNEDVIKECVDNGIPIFPGAFSPSEIYKAWDIGADIVKIFPAALLGAKYLKDVMGPFTEIKFLPTGGINLASMEEFLKIGIKAFGIGSPLFDDKLIKENKWAELGNNFSQFVNLLNQY